MSTKAESNHLVFACSYSDYFATGVDRKWIEIIILITHYLLFSTILDEFKIEQIGYFLDGDNNWALDTDELETALNKSRRGCNVSERFIAKRSPVISLLDMKHSMLFSISTIMGWSNLESFLELIWWLPNIWLLDLLPVGKLLWTTVGGGNFGQNNVFFWRFFPITHLILRLNKN